jgi:hypothetical protein
MQAIIGCCFEDKPGSWFVQLRTPADDLFDQIVLSTGFGPTREEAIEKMRRLAGVDDVIPWDNKPRMTSRGAVYPKAEGLLPAMARCGQAIDLLCFEINKLHDEI